ncbi:hypothetical protein IWX90DRAFT_132845 [Phyllosticta citrichinensis]|uniref:Secreted protein n=1 Tax=Phyllosticta citrichinensis TaxID=1130410 RepID=A0ABR1Y4P0_9PEZI
MCARLLLNYLCAPLLSLFLAGTRRVGRATYLPPGARRQRAERWQTTHTHTHTHICLRCPAVHAHLATCIEPCPT